MIYYKFVNSDMIGSHLISSILIIAAAVDWSDYCVAVV